jgi:pimeloyl-ACP methyl ester carboxylesterase
MNSPAETSGCNEPTVLLVHSASTDAGSWSGVIGLLQDAGVDVIVAANPLLGLEKDAAYIASVARQIDGRVLMVGHGYGGAVITEAAIPAGNVAGLVYIAAIVPDEGESLADLIGRFPETMFGPALRANSYPNGGVDYAVEMTLDRGDFPEVFAGDLPERQARILSAGQRPLAIAGFDDKAGPPAWKTLPGWNLIATEDKIIDPGLQRFQAERAGSVTIEIAASHAVTVSQPKTVADLILTALRAIR